MKKNTSLLIMITIMIYTQVSQGCLSDILQLASTVSSRKFKKNIESITQEEASAILKLQPVSFNFAFDSYETHYGLIAEDVAKILPRLVVYNAEKEPSGVRYGELTVLNLREIQDLARRVEQLERKVA